MSPSRARAPAPTPGELYVRPTRWLAPTRSCRTLQPPSTEVVVGCWRVFGLGLCNEWSPGAGYTSV